MNKSLKYYSFVFSECKRAKEHKLWHCFNFTWNFQVKVKLFIIIVFQVGKLLWWISLPWWPMLTNSSSCVFVIPSLKWGLIASIFQPSPPKFFALLLSITIIYWLSVHAIISCRFRRERLRRYPQRCVHWKGIQRSDRVPHVMHPGRSPLETGQQTRQRARVETNQLLAHCPHTAELHRPHGYTGVPQT